MKKPTLKRAPSIGDSSLKRKGSMRSAPSFDLPPKAPMFKKKITFKVPESPRSSQNPYGMQDTGISDKMDGMTAFLTKMNERISTLCSEVRQLKEDQEIESIRRQDEETARIERLEKLFSQSQGKTITI